MGCGASTPTRPASDADPPVTLEMTKEEGQSSGLALYVGPLGFIRIDSVKEDSPFAGLIESGDEIMAVNGKDIVSTLPVAFCSAAAHSAGVFCLGADPLFGQIVKARGAESASATAPFLTGRTGLE